MYSEIYKVPFETKLETDAITKAKISVPDWEATNKKLLHALTIYQNKFFAEHPNSSIMVKVDQDPKERMYCITLQAIEIVEFHI